MYVRDLDLWIIVCFKRNSSCDAWGLQGQQTGGAEAYGVCIAMACLSLWTFSRSAVTPVAGHNFYRHNHGRVCENTPIFMSTKFVLTVRFPIRSKSRSLGHSICKVKTTGCTQNGCNVTVRRDGCAVVGVGWVGKSQTIFRWREGKTFSPFNRPDVWAINLQSCLEGVKMLSHQCLLAEAGVGTRRLWSYRMRSKQWFEGEGNGQASEQELVFVIGYTHEVTLTLAPEIQAKN